jgi:hypothetical protein
MPESVEVACLVREDKADNKTPVEAWRRGLRLGTRGGSKALGARGTGNDGTSGGGVLRVVGGSGNGNGGGGEARGTDRDETRDGSVARGVGGSCNGIGGCGAIVGTVFAGGASEPVRGCATTHLATSETVDR